MTHFETRTQTDAWEVEVCDECGHDVSAHYDLPQDVLNKDGSIMYIAVGCMVLQPDGRTIINNPYRRCTCMHSK
jgi:hypothetical protein